MGKKEQEGRMPFLPRLSATLLGYDCVVPPIHSAVCEMNVGLPFWGNLNTWYRSSSMDKVVSIFEEKSTLTRPWPCLIWWMQHRYSSYFQLYFGLHQLFHQLQIIQLYSLLSMWHLILCYTNVFIRGGFIFIFTTLSCLIHLEMRLLRVVRLNQHNKQ